MEYHGKLYGKVGHRFFDTGKTSKDFDKLERDNSKMLKMLKRMLENYDKGTQTYLEAQKLIKEATQL
jgi:hypothetical protein